MPVGHSCVRRRCGGSSLARRVWLGLALALACPVVLGQNISVSLAGAPNLQEIVRGTTSTTFTVSDAGIVSASPTSAAAAVRVKSTSTTALTLTITCVRASSSGNRDCSGESVSFRMLEGTATGGGSISGITCASGQAQPTGVTYTCTSGGTSGSAYRDVTITFGGSASGVGWTSTLRLGVSMVVPANATRGSTSVPVSCTQTGTNTLDSFSGTGCGTAISGEILRSLSVTKTADLDFGRIVRPPTGSGTVTLAASGTRTVSGGAGIVGTSTFSPAGYAVLGEGAQAISVTVPPTVTLTSGSHSIVVTTSHDLPGGHSAQTLGGAVGTDATLHVAVGGTMALTSSTPPGRYQGPLTVTASYQ